MSTRTLRLLASLAAVGLLSTLGLAQLAAQPAVPVAKMKPVYWNASQREISKNKFETEFSTGFANFANADGKWQETDLMPKKDSTGFHISDAPFSLDAPLLATGDIRFASTNRWSVKEKRLRDDAPVSKLMRFPGAAPVPGVLTAEGILYANALPAIEADLIVFPNWKGVRNVVRWDHTPTVCQDFVGDIRVPFEQEFNNGLTPREDDGKLMGTTKKRVPGFKAFVNDFRGIGTPRGQVWDAALDRIKKIDFETRRVGNNVIAEKVIDCAFFRGATFPVYTDDTSTFFPDPTEAAGFDGRVAYDGTGAESWATVHDALTGTESDVDGLTGVCGSAEADGWEIHKLFFVILTGDTITAGATANSGTFSLVPTAITDGQNDANGVSHLITVTPASNTAIATADYDQAGTTAQATALDLTTMSAAVYNDWTLNAAGLTSIGKGAGAYTKFGCRNGFDHSNTAINTETTSRFVATLSETALTTTDPKLVVVWTAATTNPIPAQFLE